MRSFSTMRWIVLGLSQACSIGPMPFLFFVPLRQFVHLQAYGVLCGLLLLIISKLLGRTWPQTGTFHPPATNKRILFTSFGFGLMIVIGTVVTIFKWL